MQLKKATRTKAKLRIGVFGPSGAGKTFSSLQMAFGICGDWEKIAVIDTERGSADLYAHLGPYNTMSLEAPFTPERYIQAIKSCEQAGMEVIIIDSISHEWEGTGGIIEISNSMPGNSFANWAKITPRHNKFIDTILLSQAHMICCGRTKQDYVLTEQTNSKGNKVQVPEKVGLKANTREGFDYEMTLAFDIDIKHNAHTSKDRTGLFADEPAFTISKETGEKLIAWVNEGAEPAPSYVSTESVQTEEDRLSKAKNLGNLVYRLSQDYGLTPQEVLTYGELPALKDAMTAGDVEGLTRAYNLLLEFIKVNGRERKQPQAQAS